jgi:alkanesulfonate monooxygenase SsuD/methylene tetrahydromethanopterin reductase-like flavin-dependent oxidoreductase (luciferase family)
MRIVWCDMKENARDKINKIVSDQFKRTIAVSDGHPMQFDKHATDYEHTVENRCIVGTPDTCIEMIEKYAKLGVTGILCSFVTTEHTVERVEESIRLFGDEVIGYFRGFV